MLSWASSQFEKLAQTVAPPPTDPASRFVYCCQRGEENEAIQLASLLPGSGVIVNQSKQQVPLHVACTYGMMQLTRHLLNQPGASLDMLDGGGNTVLHCAASCALPVGLDLVKFLVQEMGANVCAKNYQGQTPYDVATLNNIRQFLLPIQLQQETKEALANGGTGLPPGIDMGGLKIQNAPPPPIPGSNTMGGPPPPQVGPPPQGVTGPLAQGGPSSPYPQPPNPFGQSIMTPTTSQSPVPYPQPPYSGSAPTTNQAVTPQQATTAAPPPPPAAHMTGSPLAPPAPVQQLQQQQQPTTLTSPTPAPASGGGKHEYALTGYSSAAIYRSAPGSGGGIRPDGFHSSSSDKRLQQKYGHDQTQQYAHIPPPPSSGSSLGGHSSASAGGGSASAPPSGGGHNPYAGGLAHRQRQNRYVNYGPVADNAPVVPRPYSSYGASAMGAAPAPAQYNVFRPAGAAAATAQTAPAPASTSMAATAPMPPPPFFQQPTSTPAATNPAYQHPHHQTVAPYTAPTATPAYSPPPPQQMAAPASPYAQPSPQQQGLSGHTSPFVQSPVAAVASSASAMFASPTAAVNTSSDSAAAVFSGPPSGNAPAAFSSPSLFPTRSASTSVAQDAAPSPAVSPFNSNATAQVDPASMFSSPPQATESAGGVSETAPPPTPPAAPVPVQVAFSNHEVSGVSVMSSASDHFSRPSATSPSDTTTTASPPKPSPVKSTTTSASAPVERNTTPQDDLVEIVEEEDFDNMDDVPLSPQPPLPTGGPPALGGMPPPPLSNT